MLSKLSIFKIAFTLSVPFLSLSLISESVFAFASVGTTAGVNLGNVTLDGSNTNEGSAFRPFSKSEASGNGTTTVSSADVLALELKTFSQSNEESEDIFNGGGGAIFDTDYQLTGIPEGGSLQIPLNFNVSFSGSLEAKSEIGDRDSGAIASIIYDFIHSDYRFEGSASANSAAGSPAALVSGGGFLGDAGNVNWKRASSSKYSVDQLISLPSVTDSFGGGFFIAGLTSGSLSDDGFAESNFGSTFSLESISLGEGFDPTGLEELAVIFDGGSQVKVDLPSTGPSVAQPVPETTSMPAIILSALAGAIVFSRKNRQMVTEERV